MQVAILAGGVGGSRFVRGVRAAYPEAELSVIMNTADDITLHGLRICPDLDTMMYALGGGIDPQRGWGRSGETWQVKGELAAYRVEPSWFGLGDRDLATHLVRTQMLDAGYPLSAVTEALCVRWLGGSSTADDNPRDAQDSQDVGRVRLLPMTDDRVETHVVVDDAEAPGGRRSLHFQEYWVRWHAVPVARAVVQVGIEDARPGPGVLAAIETADLVLVAPSNPVVSIGPVLAVPGVRQALVDASAPVIGFSPIIGGAPVLGMADRLLPAIGVRVDALAVGLHYGARPDGILDAFCVHDDDHQAVAGLRAAGLRAAATDLIMKDPQATAAFVKLGVDLVAPSPRDRAPHDQDES